MSNLDKRILYIDYDHANIVDNEGALVIQRPSISYGGNPTWQINFVRVNNDGTLSGIDLSEVVSYNAAIDTDFLSSTMPMVRSLDSDIDHSQAASGIISVSLNAGTETFFAKVDGRNTVPAFFEIRGRDSEDKCILDYRFPINTLGAIDPQGGDPIPIPSGGVTINDVYALLRSATEFRFSADGTNWHSQQTTGDVYYESRYPQGEWSEPIEIVKGTDGEDGHNVQFEYSENGSSWHTTPTANDKYFRTSNDGGTTWTNGILFKGADGEDGSNGIGFELLGEYNSSTTYNPPSLGNYECVYYNGSTYAYINSSSSSGHIPPDAVSDSYWMKIANKGSVESITVSDITDFNSVMSGILSGYAQKSDTYSISQIDSLLNNKANAADVYSKAEAEMKFIDTDELSSALSNRVTLTQWSDQNNRLQGEIDYLSGQISGGGGDLSNYYTKSEVNSISAYLQNEIDNIPSGGGGGSVITGGISGVALNGTNLDVNNGYVNVQALPMATTMTSGMLYSQEFLFYLGPNVNGDTYRGNLASVDFNEPELAITGLIQFTQQGGPDASGTSRYWQYGSGMDRYYKISYDTDHWKIARQDTTGGDPGPAGWTDCGTLVTAFISGQPWGIYNIMNAALTSSSYHNIYPVNCYAAADKGHLYERVGGYDDDAITIHAYNLTFTVLKYSANQWYTNRDPYDHSGQSIFACLQWEGTDIGNWTIYLIYRHGNMTDEIYFTSPTGGYAPTPWIYSGQPWNWHDDTGTITGVENVILTQAGIAGGWNDLGSMLH